jgi:ADP-L-glycero-D-manno-heptose 6-epimerase
MYIVTGGAGLIGSAIVWALNRSGIKDILIVDHLGKSDKWKNLAALRYADYLEKDDFRARVRTGAFADADIAGILHLGACSATTERDASYLIDNNFNYTKELARFAADRDIRFVYASSCATYGDGSCGYEDDEDRLDALRPLNMYGYSKHLFDLWAREQGLLNRIVGCKFSNVYGPNELHKGDMRSVALRAWEQIAAEGKMRLFRSYKPEYADGEQQRDFLYVKDAAAMVLHLFRHPSAAGIFNIGSGRAESWNSLAQAAFAALDKPVCIEYIDMPESLRDRYQYYTRAGIEKLRKTGFSAGITELPAAVDDYLRAYLIPGKHLGD